MALTHDDFKFRLELQAETAKAVVYDNVAGLSTIGVHVSFGGSGTVVFEGTFDNENWFAISLLNIASNTYVTQTTAVGKFVGNIVPYRKIRFRVTSALGSVGHIQGRASNGQTVTMARTTALS